MRMVGVFVYLFCSSFVLESIFWYFCIILSYAGGPGLHFCCGDETHAQNRLWRGMILCLKSYLWLLNHVFVSFNHVLINFIQCITSLHQWKYHPKYYFIRYACIPLILLTYISLKVAIYWRFPYKFIARLQLIFILVLRFP